MDMKKEQSVIEQTACVFSKHLDIDLDYQETVPAYLDDIYRVVNCSASGTIVSFDISFNEIKIYARISVRLTYYNDQSDLCYADFEEEFSKSLTVDGLSDKAFSYCRMTDKYTNYRVINQRRIDIHVASLLTVEVYDIKTSSFISACADAKLKKEMKTFCCVNATNLSKIEFDGEFSVAKDSPSVKRVIAAFAHPVLGETKIIKDKMLIKGTLLVSALYTTDSNEEQVLRCEHTLHFSKILEIAGIDEEDKILTHLAVAGITVKAKPTKDGNMNMMSVYGEIIATSIIIKEKERNIISDGYILNHLGECEYTYADVALDGAWMDEAKQLTLKTDLNPEISEVLDVDVSVTTPVLKGEQLMCVVNINAVYKTVGDELSSMAVSREVSFPLAGYDIVFAQAELLSFDYTVSSGSNMELRLQLRLVAYACKTSRQRLLSNITASEEKLNAPSLTVYFGSKDDRIWDIAKRFSSDTEAIIKENALSGEVLDSNQVLMIPRA